MSSADLFSVVSPVCPQRRDRVVGRGAASSGDLQHSQSLEGRSQKKQVKSMVFLLSDLVRATCHYMLQWPRHHTSLVSILPSLQTDEELKNMKKGDVDCAPAAVFTLSLKMHLIRRINNIADVRQG